MKVQLGCGAFLLSVAFAAALLFGYVANIVSLCKCDFEPAYKAEVIRTIGVVVPPVGVVVGYITIEDGETNEASLSD